MLQSIFTSAGFLLPKTPSMLVYDADVLARVKSLKPSAPKILSVSTNCLELVKHFESLHDGDKSTKNILEPEMDPVGIWTVGYGRVLRDSKGTMLKGSAKKSQAYAHELAFLTEPQYREMLKDDLNKTYLPLVIAQVGKPIYEMSQDYIDAATSFCYNCGTHYINSKGKKVPYAIWSNLISMNKTQLKSYWETSVTKAGGKVLAGLVRRRKAEAHLATTGTLKFNF